MTMPKKVRAIFTIPFVVAVGGSIFSSALPSPLVAKIALGGAMMVGAYAAWEAKPGGLFSPEGGQAEANSRGSFLMRHTFLRVPLMGLMMALFTYMGVGCGVFWVVTEVIGHEGTLAYTITGTGSGGRSCQHINVAGIDFVPDRALCATDEQMDAAIPGRQVYLSGKMSVLGLNVESIQYTAPQ